MVPAAMPNTAQIWNTTLAMALAAMAGALMWPRMAVCAACATPQSAPEIMTGAATRI